VNWRQAAWVSRQSTFCRSLLARCNLGRAFDQDFQNLPSNSEKHMATLLRGVRACTQCSGLPLGHKPILQASSRSRILVAGQAPGRITHAKGCPFDDPSGDRLRNWLGVDRETFYDPECFALVPMGFCYPGTGKGGDLPPRPECAETWRSGLLAGLNHIRLTILLGQYALRWHLGEAGKQSLTTIVAGWEQYWPEYLPLPHPSPRNQRWLKQNPHVETELIPMLRQRVSEILH
jgi:uracil-DNA glycosylase